MDYLTKVYINSSQKLGTNKYPKLSLVPCLYARNTIINRQTLQKIKKLDCYLYYYNL